MKNNTHPEKITSPELINNQEIETSQEEIKKKVDKIMMSEEEKLELIKLCNNSELTFTRIYLLRHFDYLEDENYEKYNNLRDQLKNNNHNFDYKYFWELDQSLKVDYNKINHNLLNNLFNKKENIFIHDKIDWETKVRILESINYIKENYQYPSLEKEIKWSKKIKNKQKALLEAWLEVNKIKENIKEKPEDFVWKNIILLWSRSHSHFFNELNFDKQWKDDSEKNFEKRWYDYVDYDKNGKLILQDLFLQITPENYDKIIQEFWLESEDIWMLDLQQGLNKIFEEKPELLEKYLYSEIKELKIFCLKNLIKKGKKNILDKFFKENNLEKKLIKTLKKELNPEEKIILNYYTKIYPEVLKQLSRSLDQRVIEWKNINPSFNFDNEKILDKPEKIFTQKENLIYVEWKAWAGKSFLLTYLLQAIHKANLEKVKNNEKDLTKTQYFNLSWKLLDDLKNNLKKEDNTIYFIDSIDESDIIDSEFEILDKYLKKLSDLWKVIITSRPGYRIEKWLKDRKQLGNDKLPKFKYKQKIVIEDFKEKNINLYLYGYFGEDYKKIETVNNILEKLNWSWNNPLILSMICYLVKEKKEYQEIDLESINIIKIYDDIVELRLLDYNKDIRGRDVISKRTSRLDRKRQNSLQDKIKILEQIWYSQLIWQEKMDIDDIEDFIEDNKLGLDIESLNLIYRKNLDWEYDFVHESFKEYFAAKYLVKEMKENDNFDYSKTYKLYKKELTELLPKLSINFWKKFTLLLKYNKWYMVYDIINEIFWDLWEYTDASDIFFTDKTYFNLYYNSLLVVLLREPILIFDISVTWDDIPFINEKLISVFELVWIKKFEKYITTCLDEASYKSYGLESQQIRILMKALFKIWLEKNINLIWSYFYDDNIDIRSGAIDFLLWWWY